MDYAVISHQGHIESPTALQAIATQNINTHSNALTQKAADVRVLVPMVLQMTMEYRPHPMNHHAAHRELALGALNEIYEA